LPRLSTEALGIEQECKPISNGRVTVQASVAQFRFERIAAKLQLISHLTFKDRVKINRA
jgi:hypothetical protein